MTVRLSNSLISSSKREIAPRVVANATITNKICIVRIDLKAVNDLFLASGSSLDISVEKPGSASMKIVSPTSKSMIQSPNSSFSRPLVRIIWDRSPNIMAKNSAETRNVESRTRDTE